MLEEAFLRDILTNPDDDAVRLIYADWLHEQGDPARSARGEFIHVQCQLARAEGALSGWKEWADLASRLPELRARAKALLQEYRQAWAGPLAGWPVKAYAFRRGFVESVTLPASVFLRHADELFAAAPVRRVRFTRVDVPMTRLAASPHLARLAGLDLSHTHVDDSGLGALLSSRHLGQLRELDLSHTGVGDRTARTLADSPRLAQLTHLDLSSNSLTAEGVRALLRSRYWGGLQSLNIADNYRNPAHELAALTGSLESPPRPDQLPGVLLLFGAPAPAFRSAHARGLARRAEADGARTAAVLGEGLTASHRRVRAAAAQLLGGLGANALPSLPTLVRRLYDRRRHGRDRTVFNAAAATLVRLLPSLPEELRGWLAILANPLRAPENNLRTALEKRPPQPVWESFAALCVRRAVWWDGVLGQTAPAPPAVPRYPDGIAFAGAVDRVLNVGNDKEAAWLIVRLCELLQRHYQAEVTAS